jgi:hypothetical protein
MDVHVPYAVTIGLRLRGVDELTAQKDGTAQTPIRICSTEQLTSAGYSSLKMTTCCERLLLAKSPESTSAV